MRRTRLLGLLLLLSLLAAPLTAGLPPPGTARILAIHQPGDATLAGLQAAGFPECAPLFATGDCYEAVTPTQFATEPLAGHEVLFVGTHNGPGPVYDALVLRRADIAAFVAAGGSLVTLGEPDSGTYEFLPNDNPYPIYMFDAEPSDVARRSLYGASHPALQGVSDASLQGWGPSFVRFIGERPSYTAEVIEGDAVDSDWGYTLEGYTVAIAGNWGDGCVFATTLLADRAAAGLQAPGSAPGAAEFIAAVLAWGLDCTAQPPVPSPYPTWIAISQGTPGSPATYPIAYHTPNLQCGPLTRAGSDVYVDCQPNMPAPGNTYFTCIGSMVAGHHAGLAGLTSFVKCGTANQASCTAGATGVAPNTVGACTGTAGIGIDPFPIRCVARLGAAYTSTPKFSTVCGNNDP